MSVRPQDVAAFHDQVVHPVCSTFSLAREAEWTTRQFVLDMRDDDEEGVGTFLNIEHKAPAFIGEEILFRGYLINRFIDLVGESTPGKFLIVILTGAAFGFVHYYQGSRGVVAAGIVGIFQSIIYLSHQRKLVVPIIAHGVFDTIGFAMLFFS